MSTDYCNFDLELKWYAGDPKKVSVTYVSDQQEKIPKYPIPRPYSDAYDASSESKLYSLMSNVNCPWSESDLIEAGRDVADLLLPKRKIRDRFRTFCRENDRVRLRLLYPKRPRCADFSSEEAWLKERKKWQEQLDGLLRIPWEYVYLPESDGSDVQRGWFLGIQKNISIVHCVPPLDKAPSAGVDRLKVNMAYLSALVMNREKNLNALEKTLIQRLVSALENTVLNDTQKLECETKVREAFQQARNRYVKTLEQSPTTLEGAHRCLQAFKDTLSKELLHLGCLSSNIIDSIVENYEKQDLVKFQKDETLRQGYDEAFQDFVEELEDNVLQEIIICPNISGNKQPPAEPGDVMRAFEHSDLVHIICHGSPDYIDLKDQDLGSDHIINCFQSLLNQDKALPDKLKELRVVLLVSCHSADGSGSIAHTLHQLGVPMVVGMTNSIDVLPATSFVDGFYEAIADGSVEQAVSNGRLNMFGRKIGGQRHGGFGLPRLYLYSSDSILIPQKLLYPSEDIVKYLDSYVENILKEAGSLAGGGRWVNKITGWIKSNKGTWYYVSGHSGSGKSTQIAQLIQELKHDNKCKYLYHFCTEGCPGSDHRLNFVRSLVAQLMRHFGDKKYRQWCHPDETFPLLATRTDRHITFPLLVNNADDALRDFVIEPLRKALGEKKAQESGDSPPLPVIIIDGLEYIPNKDNSVLGLLVRHRDVLDEVARFVITANEDSEANVLIRCKLVQRNEPDLRIMPIDSNDPLPMYTHFSNRLDPALKLSEQVGPSSKPWEALNDLYQHYLDHVCCETSDKKQATEIRKILQVLALAYEPLNQDFVAHIVNLSPYMMPELVRQIEPFLKGSLSLRLYKKYEHLQTAQYKLPPPSPAVEVEAEGELLTLDHISIGCFIISTLLQEDAERANAHELFVKAYRPEGGWNEVSDWSDLSKSVGVTFGDVLGATAADTSKEITRYAWLYLADHTYECYQATKIADRSKRSERSTDFLNLICNPGFRTIRLANIGLQTALEDIRRGLRVAFAEYALPADVEAPQALEAFEHVLVVMGTADDSALLGLERRLRRENGGVPALLEFLGLFVSLAD